MKWGQQGPPALSELQEQLDQPGTSGQQAPAEALARQVLQALPAASDLRERLALRDQLAQLEAWVLLGPRALRVRLEPQAPQVRLAQPAVWGLRALQARPVIPARPVRPGLRALLVQLARRAQLALPVRRELLAHPAS